MVDFFLYRIKLAFPAQRSLFEEDLTREQIFLRVLREKPSFELRPGNYWHIGNISFLDDTGGYFAVGRTTKSILEKYDLTSGNFLEEMLETSPYTHVFFDCHIGFLAIATKYKLSPTVSGIARKIKKLFENSEVIASSGVIVAVDPISDPSDFIVFLRSAFNIRRFEVTFSRSNPFDADEFFQKPMEKYLDASNGQEGRTAIVGEDLDSETLVQVTKSVAATGNDAKATLRPYRDARYSTKRLRSNPAHFKYEGEELDKREALTASRDAYANIRESDPEMERVLGKE